MPGDPEDFFGLVGDSGFFSGRRYFHPKKDGGDLLVKGHPHHPKNS